MDLRTGVLTILLFTSSVAGASTFEKLVEDAKASSYISCEIENYEEGFNKNGFKKGDMWACEEADGSFQLYISEVDARNGKLKRILLKIERNLGAGPSARQRTLVAGALRHFTGHGEALTSRFFGCSEQVLESDRYRFEFNCYQGRKIRSNVIKLYPR